MTLLRRRELPPTEEEEAAARALLWKQILLIGLAVVAGVVLLVLLVAYINNLSKPPEHVREAETHIQKAGGLFRQFMQKNRGRGPANEKEFADFVKTVPDVDLESLGIKDRDKALISPRDGQPYGVVPNASMMNPVVKSSAPAITLYEKTGSGGKRYVLYLMGAGFSEMDEEQFRRNVPSANK